MPISFSPKDIRVPLNLEKLSVLATIPPFELSVEAGGQRFDIKIVVRRQAQSKSPIRSCYTLAPRVARRSGRRNEKKDSITQ